MKKLFLLIMAMVMSFTFAACGGDTAVSSDTVGLVDVTTEQGLSLKLPSDMPLQTIQGNQLYINTETGDNAVFKVVEDSENPFFEWTEEDALATYQSTYPDASIQSFENGIEINGNESLVSMVDVTTPGGRAVTIVLVFITDGTSSYVANFTYGRDNADSILAKNIKTCIESITI